MTNQDFLRDHQDWVLLTYDFMGKEMRKKQPLGSKVSIFQEFFGGFVLPASGVRVEYIQVLFL